MRTAKRASVVVCQEFLALSSRSSLATKFSAVACCMHDPPSAERAQTQLLATVARSNAGNVAFKFLSQLSLLAAGLDEFDHLLTKLRRERGLGT